MDYQVNGITVSKEEFMDFFAMSSTTSPLTFGNSYNEVINNTSVSEDFIYVPTVVSEEVVYLWPL